MSRSEKEGEQKPEPVDKPTSDDVKGAAKEASRNDPKQA